MSLSYGWEKLFKAVHYMAATKDSPQERLAEAFGHSLHIIKADEDLPEDVRSEWIAIREAVTNKEARGNEGNIVATCSQLSTDDAGKLIQRIVSVYNTVTLALGERDAN
jgi:hypothetical protein